MGSTISYNVKLEGKDSQAKNIGKKHKRRDSATRPVLKLQISSSSMERHHRIHGETSLDHPFLKRLSSHKFSAADPVPFSPSHSSLLSHRHSSNSVLSDSSFTDPITTTLPESSDKSSTIPRSSISHSTNGQRSIGPSSSSMIVVKFVDNGNLDRNSSTTSLPERSQSTAETDRLSWVGHDENPEEEKIANNNNCDDANTGHPAVTEHIQQQLILNKVPLGRRRSQSVDEFPSKGPCRKASVKISRKITRTSSLRNQLNDSSDLDVQVTLNEGEWSFGENIMKCLEEEGILLFDVENPRTSSEKDIEQTWPGLKDKLKKWRSEQSLLDL